MTPYEEDLEYAKNVLRFIQIVRSGANIKNPNYTYADRYHFVDLHCRAGIENIVSLTEGLNDEISSNSIITRTANLMIEYLSDYSIRMVDGDDLIEIEYPELYTEEIHFQNSLLYSTLVNRYLLLCWYLKLEENRLDGISLIDVELSHYDFFVQVNGELNDTV